MDTPRPLVILGSADTTRNLFPSNIGAEVWSLAPNIAWLDKADRWFELHDPSAWERATATLQKLSPLVMQKDYLPGVEVYPLAEVLAAFPRRYFTSSFAWLMALAILRGYQEIHLYGWNMETSEEWGKQRACAEYFCGLAEGRGIKVIMAEASPMLKSGRLYAFEPATELERHLLERRQQLQKQVAEIEERVALGRAEIAAFDGARQDCEYVLRHLGVEL